MSAVINSTAMTSSQAITLFQNLHARQKLAGVFFNEAHQLDPSLVSFRSFDPVNKLFGHLSQHNVAVPAIFMSATMRHPAKILTFCGLCPNLDEELFESPMRPNLEFEVQLLKGSRNHESHPSIMTAAVAAIKKHAPSNRVVIFVMYKTEIGPIVQSLRESFPDRHGYHTNHTIVTAE